MVLQDARLKCKHFQNVNTTWLQLSIPPFLTAIAKVFDNKCLKNTMRYGPLRSFFFFGGVLVGRTRMLDRSRTSRLIPSLENPIWNGGLMYLGPYQRSFVQLTASPRLSHWKCMSPSAGRPLLVHRMFTGSNPCPVNQRSVCTRLEVDLNLLFVIYSFNYPPANFYIEIKQNNIFFSTSKTNIQHCFFSFRGNIQAGLFYFYFL